MAEIGHALDIKLEQVSRATASFAKPGVAGEYEIQGSELDGSSDYILIVDMYVGGSSSASNAPEFEIFETGVAAQLVGSHCRQEPRRTSTNVGQPYLFIKKVTTAATPNSYQIRFKGDGSVSARISSCTMLMMKLDDLAAADFAYSESATAIDNIGGTFVDGESITIGDGTSDWQIWGGAQWEVDVIGDDMQHQIDIGGTVHGPFQLEGEDTVEEFVTGYHTVISALAADTVVKNQFAAGGSNDVINNVIFALRLDAFEDHAVVRKTADTNITPLDTDVVVTTLTHTSSTAATRNWAIFGSSIYDANGTSQRIGKRAIEQAGTTIVGDTSVGVTCFPRVVQNAGADNVPHTVFGELTNHANNTDLDLDFINHEDQSLTPHADEATICAFTWELAAGGTEFTQSLAGSLAPSGALARETQKVVAGTVTPAGALVKETQKVLVGAFTPSGALVKETQKVVAGIVTPSGVLTSAMTFVQTIAGTLTPSGAITKQTQKAVGGALTATGTIIKQTRKVVAGTVAPAGVLEKETRKMFTGSLTPSGVLANAIVFAKSVAGSLPFSGTVATLFSPGGGVVVVYRRFLTMLDNLKHSKRRR